MATSTTPPPKTTTTSTATSINRGPLTTTFSGPSSCASALTQFYRSTISKADVLIQAPLSAPGACLPPQFHGQPNEYFSPGVACPSAYTTAAHGVVTSAGGLRESAVYCCPRGNHGLTYTYGRKEGFGGCHANVTAVGGVVLENVKKVNGSSTGKGEKYTMTSGGMVVAHSVQFRVGVLTAGNGTVTTTTTKKTTTATSSDGYSVAGESASGGKASSAAARTTTSSAPASTSSLTPTSSASFAVGELPGTRLGIVKVLVVGLVLAALAL